MRQHIFALMTLVFTAGTLPSFAGTSADDFTSLVNTGSITQTTAGSDNRQILNVGSASATETGKFNATVSTGAITQSSSGTGIVQTANIGSASNAKADSFTSVVITGDIEQISTKSGERQELDIGSLTNSRVNGDFKADVQVRDGVRQTGAGEIVLGSVKNSDVNSDFSTTVVVGGTVSGNNIKIGSIVGGEEFDEEGEDSTRAAESKGSNKGMKLPILGESLGKKNGSDHLNAEYNDYYLDAQIEILDTFEKWLGKAGVSYSKEFVETLGKNLYSKGLLNTLKGAPATAVDLKGLGYTLENGAKASVLLEICLSTANEVKVNYNDKNMDITEKAARATIKMTFAALTAALDTATMGSSIPLTTGASVVFDENFDYIYDKIQHNKYVDAIGEKLYQDLKDYKIGKSILGINSTQQKSASGGGVGW